MKETTKMSRAVGQLEKMYNIMNGDFYDGKLPTPIITVQSKPGTCGSATTKEVWHKKDERAYELNINADMLNFPIEQIVDTILHEMVHIYCRENEIKEVTKNGAYHNGKFKEVAESHGLHCIKTEKYGWNTEPDDKLIEYILEKEWSEIKIGRNGIYSLLEILATGNEKGTGKGKGKKEKKPSSTRKLICPKCGQTCRVTKREANIICGDCMERMIEKS